MLMFIAVAKALTSEKVLSTYAVLRTMTSFRRRE
jgi:hypothetical protein